MGNDKQQLPVAAERVSDAQGRRRRGGVIDFLAHVHPPWIPRERVRFTFTFCMGGLAAYLFLVLALTGVLLMFHYRTGGAAPYLSVREITEIVPYGELIRSLHYWGGQWMVALILFHMIRVVLTESHQGAKRWIWVVGVLLLALMLIIDFSGYLLRFDRDTFWAGFVAFGVIREIPYVGEGLHRLLTGTGTYGSASIQRIYLWHCVVLPMTVFGFMLYHFWKVSRLGYMGRFL